ncbi:retrovirus-related pol polyprotein from transposon TNT 1-94 [Tanacetum coccineum]
MEGILSKPNNPTIFSTFSNNQSKEGHTKAECYKLVGYPVGHPLYGKYPAKQPPKSINDSKNYRTVNMVMGQNEQMEMDQNEKTEASPNQNNSTPDSHVSTRMDQLQNQLNQVLMMLQNNKEPYIGKIYSNFAQIPMFTTSLICDLIVAWIKDSGATDHICTALDLMINIQTFTNPIFITLPNGQNTQVTQHGSVIINEFITLHNVFYDQDHRIALGSLCNGLYLLNKEPTSSSSPHTAFTLSSKQHIWHSRLGHSSPNAAKDPRWVKAMTKEIQDLEGNNIWELTVLPPHKLPIGIKWVFRIKYNVDSSIERFKASLVAKGLIKKKAWTTKRHLHQLLMVIVRALLTTVIQQNWFLEQLDFNNAFLHGDLNEEVYMTVPQGYYTSLPPNTVCKLKKFLYGLKQANRQWFTKLTNFLLLLGFQQSYVDTSLFTLQNQTNFLTLLVYVDDILLAGNNQSLINSIKKKYALKLLQSRQVLNDKPATIPIDPQSPLNDNEGTLLLDPSRYRTLVGKLIYLTITRPDISFAAQLLSQFSHSLRKTHMKALTRVLRYIKLSPGQGLHFTPITNPQLQAYYDSDWAACPITRRFVTDAAIFLGKCIISWTSKKQYVVSRSSTEAEYRALANSTCEITWLKCLLKDQQIPLTKPTIIYCDNSSTIALAFNPIQHART